MTPENAAQLLSLTGVTELHASARSPRRSTMAVPDGVSMGAGSDERQWPQCDPDKVNAIKQGECCYICSFSTRSRAETYDINFSIVCDFFFC